MLKENECITDNINMENLYLEKEKCEKIDLINIGVSIIPTLLAANSGTQLLLCFCFLVNLMSIVRYSLSKKELNEIKKYRLYDSMKEDLKKNENQNITQILDEPMYAKIINENTLDDFSYREVKLLKRELNKRKNK